MIRHIVLFKLKLGRSWRDAEVQEAERIAQEVGCRVPDLKHWYVGRNVSKRPVAHDFVAMGLLSDDEALRRYLEHPFHLEAIARWRAISDWVIADVVEEDATIHTGGL
jgi:Stress responsive A/B Barrel Domain